MFIAERQRCWLEHSQSRPVYPVMQFIGNRLEIGAGTVLACLADDPIQGRLFDIEGQETRILALLAAAYQRPVSPQVLDYIRRGAKEWVRGEACLAQIHLALTGLPRLEAPEEAAYRLFMAEGLMDEGTPPRDILRALDLDPAPLDRIDKIYDQAELRVPKGSGRPSGEWTIGGALGTMAVTAEHFFAHDIPAEALAALARFTARFVTPTAVFGLAVIPSAAGTPIVEGELPGGRGLRYSWSQDEGRLVFTATIAGQPVTVEDAHIGLDGVFYTSGHYPVARDLGGQLVVDIAAATAQVDTILDAEDDDLDQTLPLPRADVRARAEPKLCPAPGKDKAGRNGDDDENPKYVKDRAYEDFVKKLVNDPPTPSGFGVQLPNPSVGGKLVYYDDCQRSTGMLHEYKGTGYAEPLSRTDDFMEGIFTAKWLNQARRQEAASAGRPIEWDFAEQGAADYVRELFKDHPNLARIQVRWIPWGKQSK